MLSMMTMYGAYPAIPYAKAVDALIDVSVTLTDSDPAASVATTTIAFTTATALVSGDLLIINFDEGNNFTNLLQANVTCPAGNFGAPTVASEKITCAATGAVGAGTLEVIVTNVVNPVAGMYRLNVYTTDAGETAMYERAEPMIAIVDNVLMTARVTSTLNFTISGTATTTTVNGVSCDIDTSASSTLLDFGVLDVGASTTICQELTVTTNADDGYSVVVYQDDEMRSDSDSTINSFDNMADGTGSSTPHAWTAPTVIIDNYETYGHMGFTSDDLSLAAGDTFGATTDSSLYVGFDGYGSANAVEVMHHNAPADGSTVDKGFTTVAYTAEISALQEAGDYETILTYIATPTY